MSVVSPIAAVRVVGVRPAMPDAGSDPSEDGLDVELVTEPLVQAQPTDRVAAAATSSDSSHDPARRGYSVTTLTNVAPVGPMDVPAGRGPGGAQGNAAVVTGFDPRPASSLGDPPRGSFSTPFARAMQSFAQR